MMKILGLQKLTLIDYPGKVACTIFLFGCNFRCGFCHNPELVLGDNFGIVPEKAPTQISPSARPTLFENTGSEKQKASDENVGQSSLQSYPEEFVIDFLKERKKYLDGVCITGGEPLMFLEKDFLKRVKALGYVIKIDTNGSFPERLKDFIDEGLVDFVAMDIKASKESYKNVVDTDFDLEKIEESIKLIAGLPNHEFRTTVVKRFHDVHEMKELVSWVGGLIGGKIKRFALQGFKKNGKMVDASFAEEDDVEEDYLLELKKVCDGCCGEVLVRV